MNWPREGIHDSWDLYTNVRVHVKGGVGLKNFCGCPPSPGNRAPATAAVMILVALLSSKMNPNAGEFVPGRVCSGFSLAFHHSTLFL